MADKDLPESFFNLLHLRLHRNVL